MKTLCKAVCIAIGFIILVGIKSNAKMIEVDLGDVCVSAYSPACNTPAGSRQTSTGHVATSKRTIAVDRRNPIVPIGSKIMFEGDDTVYTVEDTGAFGKYGRDFDLFFDTRQEVNDWGVRYVKAKLLRKETKKEKIKRLKETRIKRQKEPFIFVYDPTLLPWEYVADKTYIHTGTAKSGYFAYPIVGSEKKYGNKIHTGNKTICITKSIVFNEVKEGDLSSHTFKE